MNQWVTGEMDNSATSLYFISNSAGAIKIAVSADVLTRISDIQIGSPTKLVLLGCVPGTREDEMRMHRRFRFIRMEGEWFQDTPELREAIEQELTVCQAMQATAAWHKTTGTPLVR